MNRFVPALLCGVFCAALLAPAAHAIPAVPDPFKVDTVGAGFTTPTAIAFLPGGRMLVAEKRGRVYTLRNGVTSATPLWSRENEVLNEHDRGLLGLAVDPNYASNRYLYLMYTVDPDSNGTDTNNDAFSRIVRYQVSAIDSNTVDYSTRAVLMGVSWRYGPLSASPSHTIGSLRFGSDGSLIASVGDGASYSTIDAGGLDAAAFGSGPNRTDPYEDIGAFRSQSLTSLCGKILRIDPATGHGYPSNPYWDGDPTSIRSRVWAYGVRNPFRICLRPGTGSANPADGDPGTVYIGDVGMNVWEDMNVVRSPGLNFGWPCYEGMGPHTGYQGASPAHNGCNSFGQPDNPAPHTPPAATWHHSNASLSVPPGVRGNAAVGGVFYTGNRYPLEYRNAYFFADYGQNWIQYATFDAADQLVSIQPFGTAMDAPVDFATDPASGDIYYVAIGTGQVRRIRYTGTLANIPPVAAASASPTAGVAPLDVAFSSAGSSDPDGDPIGVAWDFGDGSGSTLAAPSHVYAAPGSYAAVLTVTDDRGGLTRDTVVVAVIGTSGFPTTPVVDAFDRADGPVGGAWVGETAGLSISGQALTAPAGSASAVWDGAVFGPNQEAYVTLQAVTVSAPEHDLMLKVQGTNWDAGHLEVFYSAPLGRVTVATYHPASGWVEHQVIEPVTLAAGERLGARALADGTVQVFRNESLIGTASVAAWPFAALGGRIGLTLIGATATRLDDFGGGDVGLAVNTPPTSIVLEPGDGGFFAEGDTIRLRGDGSDGQQAAGELQYRWRVDLHHNNHVHPSAFVSDSRDDFFLGENHDDGTGVFYRAHLEVTDSGGMKDTASVSVYPEVNLRPIAPATVPGAPFAGAPTEFRVTLENTGRMPSPFVHWTLRAGGAVVAEGDTLVPGLGRVDVAAVAPAPAAGPHTLRATVDSAGAVVETAEDDNAAVADIEVAATALAVTSPPVSLALSAPRPNPSIGESRLTLDLPARATVTFIVYDLQGRAVWSAPARALGAGRWDLAWSGDAGGRRVRPGLYLAVVSVGERTFVRRIARL